MYLGFERVEADNTIKDSSSLTVPANATQAEIQADTNPVRYTMDNLTNPTQTNGMIFVANADPKEFLVDDINRIRYTRGAAVNGFLNIHYFGGRDV